MNCTIAAENSRNSSILKLLLDNQTTHFKICQEIELNHYLSFDEILPCEVLFFPPSKNTIPFVNHLIQQRPGIIPVLFSELNHPDIPLINSAALEMISIPFDALQLLQLENKLVDLKSLYERSEPFAEGWNRALNFFLNQLGARNPERIVLPDINGYHEVHASELLILEGNGPYSRVQLADGNCATLCKPLTHFEQVLSPSQFFRLNNDYLVNSSSIVNWKMHPPTEAVLFDGTIVPISPRRVPLLIEMIQQNGAFGADNNQNDN